MLIWTIINALLILMISGMIISVVFFIIHYLIIFKIWEEW